MKLNGKFVEVIPMREQSVEAICEPLEVGWFYRHGLRKILLSDQGRKVDGKAVRELCAKLGSIKQALRCHLAEFGSEKVHWPSILQHGTFSHNSLMNRSKRFTPNELMYGMRLRSVLDQAVEGIGPSRSPGSSVEEGAAASKWVEADENITKAQEQTKNQYNVKTMHTSKCVASGKRVMLKQFVREDGLDPLYRVATKWSELALPTSRLRKGMENMFGLT